MFAPAPSSISFVPLTRNLSLADPSPYPGVDRPLRGNCHSLQSIHRLLNVPPVATVKLGNAYQFEKFGTGNSLLRYGIRIRCSKRHPGVRDAFSEAFGVKNRLFRYGRDIRCAKQASVVRDAFSKARRTAPATLNDFQRPTEQPTPQTVDSPLPDRTHFRGAPCQKQHLPTGRIFRGVPCQKQHLPQRQPLQCAKRPPLGGEQI